MKYIRLFDGQASAIDKEYETPIVAGLKTVSGKAAYGAVSLGDTALCSADGEFIKFEPSYGIITYVSMFNDVIIPDTFDATIVSNTYDYENNEGTIKYSGTLTTFKFPPTSALLDVSFDELPDVVSLDNEFYGLMRLNSVIFTELPKVTSMVKCFYGKDYLTSVTLPDLPSITDMTNCFYDCTSLTDITIGNLGDGIATGKQDWGLSKCTSLTAQSLSNIFNSLPMATSSPTLVIGETLMKLVTSDMKAIYKAKGWGVS